jgi:hypothetical protein
MHAAMLDARQSLTLSEREYRIHRETSAAATNGYPPVPQIPQAMDSATGVKREKHGHRDADVKADENADVEAHKHGHRDADITADDDSNDVEAHKHGGKDS